MIKKAVEMSNKKRKSLLRSDGEKMADLIISARDMAVARLGNKSRPAWFSNAATGESRSVCLLGP